MTLKNKTIFITGASRGIGREIALRCAADGANLILTAKSVEEGKLPGTIYSVAKEVEEAGGNALPIKVDVRHESEIESAVNQAVEKFGGIDGLINNAGAIFLQPMEQLEPKRLDLMLQVNVRATLLTAHYCIPHLKKNGGQIINLSPPVNMAPKWFENHVAYTISKYGMSHATIGLAEELRQYKIGVNSLWPRTAIATAAINWLMGEEGMKASRTPAIMADAAYEILTSDASLTGNHLLDEPFLKDKGYTDFEKYAVTPGAKLWTDLFVDPE